MATTIISKAPIVIEKELKALIEHTKELPRGSIVKHEEIEAVSGISRDDLKKWPKLIKQWKQWHFRERQISIRPEKRLGYRLLMENEQIHYGAHQEHRGAKIISQAAAIAGVVPQDKLSDDAKQQQRQLVEHCTNVVEHRNTSAAKMKPIITIPQVMPRIRFLPNGNGNGNGSGKPK